MNKQEESSNELKERDIDITKDNWEEMIDKIKKSGIPYNEIRETKD